MKTKVLIAGLAGASLGTEIIKCLSSAGEYEIFGCDITPLAFGLYTQQLQQSFIADANNYIESVVNICLENNIKFIVPGGEQPMVLLGASNEILKANGILLAGNSADIIALFSNKEKTFEFLKSLGLPVPQTKRIYGRGDLTGVSFPCIVKPSSGTGGSDSVFLATEMEECVLYVELLTRNKKEVIVQEYIGIEEGEFTIGVLSDTHTNIIGSMAMQRIFNSKLSIAYKGAKGLISSGYSQGLISDFVDIRKQAEHIAKSSGSTGPLNIQGRVRNGILIPFEINPRFSASTHLRNMAGFNEIHFYLQHLITGNCEFDWEMQEGYYLRSFDEMFLPINDLKK